MNESEIFSWTPWQGATDPTLRITALKDHFQCFCIYLQYLTSFMILLCLFPLTIVILVQKNKGSK